MITFSDYMNMYLDNPRLCYKTIRTDKGIWEVVGQIYKYQ